MRVVLIDRDPARKAVVGSLIAAQGRSTVEHDCLAAALDDPLSCNVRLWIADWSLVASDAEQLVRRLWPEPSRRRPWLLCFADPPALSTIAPYIQRYPLDYILTPLHEQDFIARLMMLGRCVDECERLHAAEQQRNEMVDRLQRVTDNLPGTLYQVALSAESKLYFRYISDGCRTMFGLEPDDIIADSQRLFSLLHRDDLERFSRSVAESVKNFEPWIFEGRAVLPNGEIRWIQGRSKPHRLVTGEIGWDGILIDTTERRRAEETLKDTLYRFDLAVRGGSDGLWDMRPQGGQTPQTPADMWFSPNMKTWLSVESDRPEALSQAWMEAIHPEDQSRVLNAVQDHLVNRFPYDVEYRLKTAGDQYRWYSARGQATWDDDGIPIRMAGSIRDITERKELENQLKASEKLAAIGHMAARLAHEINNPLAGIKNAFLLLKDAIATTHQHYGYVARINKEIDRIAEIIRQMYTLYLPVSHHGNCLVKDVIDDVVGLISVNNKAGGVQLVVDSSIATESIAAVSEVSLRQVLINLLQNAIEASRRDDVVRIELLGQPDKIVLVITDSGIGIAQDQLERVFEPFFTTKCNRPSGGLGLGLSIAQSLTQAMRGDLRIESTLGRGTRCILTVPALPLQAQAPNDDRNGMMTI